MKKVHLGLKLDTKKEASIGDFKILMELFFMSILTYSMQVLIYIS
jgi:hypothetical protein